MWLDNKHHPFISPSLSNLLNNARTCDAYLRARTAKSKELCILRVIRHFISDEDFNINERPFDFDCLTHEIYTDYLLSHRNRSGGPLRAKVYSNKRSALHWLLNKYKYKRTPVFDDGVNEMLHGLKRTVASATKDGIGDVEVGAKECSFELYHKLNQWWIADGSRTAIFARAYLTLTWNLICRGESTQGVCIKHLDWVGDACPLYFSHQKNDQEGSRNFKPRHIYANPDDPTICSVLAIFEYLTVFPEVLCDPDGRLFPGAEDQEKRFGLLESRRLVL